VTATEPITGETEIVGDRDHVKTKIVGETIEIIEIVIVETIVIETPADVKIVIIDGDLVRAIVSADPADHLVIAARGTLAKVRQERLIIPPPLPLQKINLPSSIDFRFN